MYLIDFSPFLPRSQHLWPPIVFIAQQVPSEKGSTLKENNLFPLERGKSHFDSCLPRKCIHSHLILYVHMLDLALE